MNKCSRLSRCFVIATLLATASLRGEYLHAELALVENGTCRVPIVVASNAPAANLEAAKELAACIEKISGARPTVIVSNFGPLPESAIWVGPHPALATAVPHLKMEFLNPEEILIACDGTNLVIAGRDGFAKEVQTEFGTANAVYTFLQKNLDVRWLWPGELGEDIVPRRTISLPSFETRFHPILRQRLFRYPTRTVAHAPEVIQWWDVHQRCRGSLDTGGSHSFGKWWELYHEAHPDYFALKPDGTRSAERPDRVKICVSNPRVAQQWLEDAEKTLRENPDQTLISVAPNDGGGWCVCDNCRAWDNPNGPPDELYGQPYVMLTDRYVRFWNILAREIKKRFPDRKIYLSTIAYSRYRTPPVGEQLEDNILIGYVGHFPFGSQASREEQKEDFKTWSGMATILKYRPNLFYGGGGIWAFPEVALHNTIEDFRFLAENRAVALDVDSAQMNFATLGPQLYLMAQLAYDPLQDGQSLLADYYHRGFGAAADDIAAYWALMDSTRAAIAERSVKRGDLGPILQEIYNEQLLARADALLSAADAKAAPGPEKFRRRIAFVRAGLDYLRLNTRIMPAMAQLRKGGDPRARQQAVELCEARDALFRDAPPFALDGKRILAQIARRGATDFLGPPKPPQGAASADGTAIKPVRLAPAKWKLAFSDDFERKDLGPDWEVSSGVWSIENGQLMGKAGILLTARSFPGLQRLQFNATYLTQSFDGSGAQSKPGDISPFIHAGPTGIRSGYFLQFGGGWNTRNTLQRLGAVLRTEQDHKIATDRTHAIAAEFDGKNVRLIVDGEVLFEYPEQYPLLGPGHERLGFYLYAPAAIDNVRIYTSEARAWDPNLNDPDAE